VQRCNNNNNNNALVYLGRENCTERTILIIIRHRKPKPATSAATYIININVMWVKLLDTREYGIASVWWITTTPERKTTRNFGFARGSRGKNRARAPNCSALRECKIVCTFLRVTSVRYTPICLCAGIGVHRGIGINIFPTFRDL